MIAGLGGARDTLLAVGIVAAMATSRRDDDRRLVARIIAGNAGAVEEFTSHFRQFIYDTDSFAETPAGGG